jgi:hypothetical protein
MITSWFGVDLAHHNQIHSKRRGTIILYNYLSLLEDYSLSNDNEWMAVGEDCRRFAMVFLAAHVRPLVRFWCVFVQLTSLQCDSCVRISTSSSLSWAFIVFCSLLCFDKHWAVIDGADDRGFTDALGQSHSKLFDVAKFAFPKQYDVPARAAQLGLIPLVTVNGPLELREPVFPVSCRSTGTGATCVSVPETTVDEDDDLILRENDVRLTWQARVMETVTKP